MAPLKLVIGNKNYSSWSMRPWLALRANDIAFHAGNYSTNLHPIGIEHERYAAHGGTWYTEAQYQATADLVKYLAARFGIPLDRQRIIGHDNVAGDTGPKLARMHWDPGPYFDWTRFMALLGHPVRPSAPPGSPVVTINTRAPQVVTDCLGDGSAQPATPASFLSVVERRRGVGEEVEFMLRMFPAGARAHHWG